MKLKAILAKWLRKLANHLNPEIRINDATAPFPLPLHETSHNLQKVSIKLDYPGYVCNQHPNFEVIVRDNLAHKVAEVLVSGDAMKLTKQNEGCNVSFIAEIKVLSPYG